MKRYVSLAGALVIGTVVAHEKKPAFKTEVAQAKAQETTTVKALFLNSQQVKKVRNESCHSQESLESPVKVMVDDSSATSEDSSIGTSEGTSEDVPAQV